VKLQKHTNHIAGKAEIPKNGQDLQSQSEQETNNNFCLLKGSGR
jgi:hypothetical protein